MAAASFIQVIINHYLTKFQKEEMKSLVTEALKRENGDQSWEYIYRVRGLWHWFIMKKPIEKSLNKLTQHCHAFAQMQISLKIR